LIIFYFKNAAILLVAISVFIIGYGYWGDSSANIIVEKEIPHQENLIAQYQIDLNLLERNMSEVNLRFQRIQKAYDDYVDDEYGYLIETGVSLLIPLPSIVSELSTLSTIGDLIGHAEESIDRLDEFLEAKERHDEQCQALRRQIEYKKKLLSDTNEKILTLRADADRKKGSSPIAKFYGKLLAGVGAFGLILSLFLKRKR
jgi:hypothetical protein